MRNPFGYSIAGRLRLFSLVSLVPVVVLAGLLLYQFWVVRPEQAKEHAFEMATEASHQVDDFLSSTVKVLTAISHSPYVEAQRAAESTAYLKHVNERYPEYDNLTVTDARGIIIAGAHPESIGVSVGDRPHVREVMETGKPSVSDVIVSRITGLPTIVISYPVINDQAGVVGTVAATVDLAHLPLSLPRIELQTEHRLAVFDRQGQLVFLAAPPGEDAGLSNCTRCHSFPTVGGGLDRQFWIGNDNFHTAAPTSTGWTVVVTAPAELVTGREERTAWGVLLMVLTILGISLLGANFTGRRLGGPILRLAEASRRFGAGEQVQPVPQSTKGEIATLTQSFNSMVKEIGEGRHRQDRQQSRLHTLWELDLAISSTLSLSGVLDLVADEMERQGVLTGLAIYLTQDQAGPAPVLARGTARPLVTGRAQASLEQLVADVLQAGTPIMQEVETASAETPASHPNANPVACYGVPLAAKGRLLGAIIFCAGSLQAFGQDEREFLYGVGLQTSTAAENARLYGSEQSRVADLEKLSEELRRQRDELQRAQEGIVETLNLALQAKDPYTRGHAERVGLLSRRTAARLGIPREKQDMLARAARLHDIGKINIPERLLSKDGALTPPERTQFELHPERSAELLRHLPDLDQVLPAIRGHHERYDGKGYPDGLAGEDIPLEARIIAVADSYDALTTDRPYRGALGHEQALEVLRNGAGTQWDAAIVQMLIDSLEDDQHLEDSRTFSSGTDSLH